MRNIFFAKKTSDGAKSKKQLQKSTQGTHVTWLINVRFLYIGKGTLNNQLAVEFCRPAEAFKYGIGSPKHGFFFYSKLIDIC